MPPRKRTRRSGGIPGDPPTQAAGRSASPSVLSQLQAPAEEPAYRTRHRRVVRGPEVARREGGVGDLVPPSDDEEYDEWRAVRAVERVEGGEEGEDGGHWGGGEGPSRHGLQVSPGSRGSPAGQNSQEGPQATHSLRTSENAIAGPSRLPFPSPSLSPSPTKRTYSRRTSPQPFRPLFEDWNSSESDWDSTSPHSSQGGPSYKGKEKAAPAPALAQRISLSSPKPFARRASSHDGGSSPVAMRSSSFQRGEREVSLAPEGARIDGPDPPVVLEGDETDEEDVRGDGAHRYGAGEGEEVGVLGGSLRELEVDDFPVPVEMVELGSLQYTASGTASLGGLREAPPSADYGEDEGDIVEVARERSASFKASLEEGLTEQPMSPGGDFDFWEEGEPPSTTPTMPLSVPPSSQERASSQQEDSLQFALSQSATGNAHASPRLALSPAPKRAATVAVRGRTSSPLHGLGATPQAATQHEASLASRASAPTTPTAVRHLSYPDSDALLGLAATPTSTGARRARNAASSRPETARRVQSQAPPQPSSSPDALDLLAADDSMFNMPHEPPQPVPTSNRQASAARPPSQAISARSNDTAFISTDPALLQFRSARTFRTRTALQLQPYTKEKQLYESVLRRGGLSKGRRGVAPASQVRAAADDQDVDDPASVGEDSSSEEEHIAPEAIVIGGTPPHSQRRRRTPKALVDNDYDEYYAKFGEVPVEDDDLAQRRLQAIARLRIRNEKQLKREERAAERTRRRFEALMREEEKEQKSKEKEERQKQKEAEVKEREERQKLKAAALERREERRKEKAERAEKAGGRARADSTKRQTERTPGSKRPRTYGRKRDAAARERANAGSDSDSPLSSAPPSPSTADRLANQSPPRLPSLSPLQRRPFPPSPSESPPPIEVLSSPVNFALDGEEDPEFAMFDEYPDNVETPIPSAPNARTPISTKRRRVIASSSQSSEDSDNDAHDQRHAPAGDRRRRIAERMLPRAMLKRLESEAQRKQREREERRRAAVRVESPVRPGHAVVRRGGGGHDGAMADLFSNSASDDDIQEIHVLEAEEGSDGSNPDGSDSDGSLGRPVVVSDTSGSEAMEDNRANDGLARLQKGDFEAIIHGRTPGEKRQAERRKNRDQDRQRQRNLDRRPALGLVKTVRAPGHRSRRLTQTRIDFPVVETPVWDAGKKSKASRHRSRLSHEYQSRARGGGKKRRPAIRLDDRVIFASDDFDFPSASEPEGDVARRAPQKKSLVTVTLRDDGRLGRRTASPSPAPFLAAPAVRVQLDEGVGKARSWANFDKFPIDFDITPLPSGVYCADTIPGSNLPALLATLNGAPVDEPKPVFAFGVTLHSEMPVDEILAVTPVVLEGVYTSIQTFVDAASSSPKPDLAPLAFIRDYFARTDDEARASLLPQLRNFGDRLNGISLSGVKHERPLIEQVLLARYAMFEMGSILCEDILPLGEAVLDLLVTYGFDRTVRSLRRILRGRAETPEIKDVTVSVWVAVMHILGARQNLDSDDDLFITIVSRVLDNRYNKEVGPLAAERVWFLIFGLCALSQFGADGLVCAEYAPHPRWALVKRALGLIKVTHSQEAEESARHDQLQGRDRYIKTMVARCLRLSSMWQWSFDRSSFSVATRDLGMIFKERQHRNLPTEPPVDFPRFISEFDISLTASDETRGSSAFELWLRLASVAASDLIASAEELAEAQRAERDVQRLIMSIFPLSAVPFTREKPPTPRQLAALINRYSTMVVACYFSPSLLSWLLANSQKWLAFEKADFNSRQVCIRGLMYLAVACRHHGHPLDAVVSRLADILATLQEELEGIGRSSHTHQMLTRVEIERTMVLVVSCFRQIILHPGYATTPDPVYPDPALLHESWTARVFQLDLAKDVKSGLEIIATIQAFLDARSAALPKRARHAREARQKESMDEYPSLGFDFDAVDLAALGGDEAPEDPVEVQDATFAKIIRDVICPRMYRLLSDMLPPVEEIREPAERAEHLILINKLTKCWSDCAGIVVVEHQLMEWSAYVGPFGQQSWSRLPNELGRIRVGLQFMLNVTRLDPGAFHSDYEEVFITLLFQTIVTDRLTVEHKYAAALFALPGASEHALFEGIAALGVEDMDRGAFMEKRGAILEVIFTNIPLLLQSRWTPAAMKPLIYRCVNLLVSALAMYEGAIDKRSVLHKETYRLFCAETVHRLKRLAGDFMTPEAVPALRTINWA